jgi:hypothetical protein
MIVFVINCAFIKVDCQIEDKVLSLAKGKGMGLALVGKKNTPNNIASTRIGQGCLLNISKVLLG